MNKTVSLLMIAFVSFSCISKQSNLKSDLETANLKGNVWKIGKTVHDANSGCACPAAMKIECNQTEFVYDSKGKLQVTYTIDENGSVNDSSYYIYNKRGVCSEIIKFSSKKPAGKEVPVYQKASLTGYQIYDEKGKIETTLKYLNAGNEISEEITLNSNGEMVRSVQNEFLNGQLVSQTEKDSSGNVRSISKFKRNENNDIIEYIVLIKKDNQEIRFTYEYEYDSTGNWVKQTRLYAGQIENIVVRNIVYHTTNVNSSDV